MTAHLTDLLAEARIVPVLTVPDPTTAAPLARAQIRRLTAEAVERSMPWPT
jgi:2-keto-3-deoxy-6-phosphogluconate aldolase